MNIVRLCGVKAKVTAREDGKEYTQDIDFCIYAHDQKEAEELCPEYDILCLSELSSISGADVELSINDVGDDEALDLDCDEDRERMEKVWSTSPLYKRGERIEIGLNLGWVKEEYEDDFDELAADDRRHGI